MRRFLMIFTMLAMFFMGAGLAAGEGKVTFNFQDVDIRSVIESVSKLTGKTFIVDPAVKGKVTIVSTQAMSEAEIYGVFLSVLQVHEFVAVDSGEVVKIIPLVRAKQDMTNAYVDSEAPKAPEDRAITVLYKLHNVPANQLVPVLRPLVDPKSYLAAHDESNMIIISDRAANVERLTRIIKRIDVAGTGEIQMVHLEHADARDVVTVIEGLMRSAQKKEAPGTDKFQAVADERTNSILLAGDQADILRMKSLIAYLDTPVAAEGSTQVVFLRFAKAKDLAGILSGSGVAIELPGEKKAPQKAPAGKSEVNIQADEANNALIITAAPQAMKALQDVIRKLDIRRAQVVIEAVIAEISTDKSAELGIQWRSTDGMADKNGYIGGTNFGANGINALSVNPLSVGDGFSMGYFRGTTKILGKEILNLGAVIRALAGDGDANILSTPTLVTMDNEEATFSVGKNVPFLTGSYTSTGSATAGTSSTPSNPFQTIERKDVGLLLKVKPQINEGDTIRLDIEQETSSIAPDTVGSDIITNTRKIKTNVMVEDGKILVLGGLIQDDVTESVKKVPLLGDIPVLGALFRYTTSTHNKRNLMVFLRPVVLRNEATSDRITFDKYDFMRRQQVKAAEHHILLMPGEKQPVMPERALLPPEPAPAQPEPAPAQSEPAPVQPEPAPVQPEPAPAWPQPLWPGKE